MSHAAFCLGFVSLGSSCALWVMCIVARLHLRTRIVACSDVDTSLAFNTPPHVAPNTDVSFSRKTRAAFNRARRKGAKVASQTKLKLQRAMRRVKKLRLRRSQKLQEAVQHTTDVASVGTKVAADSWVLLLKEMRHRLKVHVRAWVLLLRDRWCSPHLHA